jgi:hypothetical protein
MLPVRKAVMFKRHEERKSNVLLPQPPPRSTRVVPNPGPSGFVDGLIE